MVTQMMIGGPHGSPWPHGVPGPMGPKEKRHGGPTKGNKKEAILSNTYDFGRLSRFPDNIFREVIFWKINGFYSS